MDYKKLLDDSKAELEELNKKEAIIKETIKTKAQELGFEVNDELEQNLLKKKEEVSQKITNAENEIAKLTAELEQINLSTDEQD